MLKVSSVLSLTDTPSQSLPPLIDSSINDVVINVAPLLKLVVLSNGRRHRSGSGRLALAKLQLQQGLVVRPLQTDRWRITLSRGINNK